MNRKLKKCSEPDCYRIKKTSLKQVTQTHGFSGQKFQSCGVPTKSSNCSNRFCVELALKGVLCTRLDREGPLNILSNTALKAQGSDSYAMLVSSTKSGGTAHGCHHSRVGVSVLVCMSLTLGSASYLTKAIYVTVKYFFHR